MILWANSYILDWGFTILYAHLYKLKSGGCLVVIAEHWLHKPGVLDFYYTLEIDIFYSNSNSYSIICRSAARPEIKHDGGLGACTPG